MKVRLHRDVRIAENFPPDIIKKISLGFHGLVADYYFMKALGSFGDIRTMSLDDAERFYKVLDMSTELDARFQAPYIIGGLLLTMRADTARLAISILEKGWAQYPSRWLFPFLAGFNYLFDVKDPVKAASYFASASKIEGSPLYLKNLAARILVQGPLKEEAVPLLRELAKDIQDPRLKIMVNENIRRYR